MSNCGKYSEKARTKYFIKQKLKKHSYNKYLSYSPNVMLCIYENHPKHKTRHQQFNANDGVLKYQCLCFNLIIQIRIIYNLIFWNFKCQAFIFIIISLSRKHSIFCTTSNTLLETLHCKQSTSFSP